MSSSLMLLSFRSFIRRWTPWNLQITCLIIPHLVFKTASCSCCKSLQIILIEMLMHKHPKLVLFLWCCDGILQYEHVWVAQHDFDKLGAQTWEFRVSNVEIHVRKVSTYCKAQAFDTAYKWSYYVNEERISWFRLYLKILPLHEQFGML